MGILLRSVTPLRSWIKMLSHSSSYSSPKITVTPNSCLHDEPVAVTVSGLDSNEQYTLTSHIKDCKGVSFRSSAHYRSDTDGCIDVTRQSSGGGHYSGVFPMGLFSCLLPEKRLHRFSYSDVTAPLDFQLSVFDGPIGPPLAVYGAEAMGAKPCCQATHRRMLLAPGVTRTVVRSGRVRGVLHMPPGDGPFPGVVDMFGTAGGLMEHRSALLASRGFASLSLAFFNYEDLPQSMDDMELSYFEEAVQYLLSVNKVHKSGGVGAIGVSKSGDIVLNMALRIPELTACVVINACVATFWCPLTLKDGTVLPALPYTFDNILVLRDGVFNTLNCHSSLSEYPNTIIPVERINKPILWIVGLDDHNMKGEESVDMAVSRRESLPQHERDKLTVMKYPKTGHLIEPPYVPFCDVSFHGMAKTGIDWGGSPLEHCQAQEHSWQKILTFFRENLMPNENKSKL